MDRVPPDEQPATVDQSRDVSLAVGAAITGLIVALAAFNWFLAGHVTSLVLGHFGYHGDVLDVGTISSEAALRVAYVATAAYLAVIAAAAMCLGAALAPRRPLVHGVIAGLTPFVLTAIEAWPPDQAPEFGLLLASLAGMVLGFVVARRMGRRRALRRRLTAV